MSSFNELSVIQRRALIDLRQAYQAWADGSRQARRHFAGSMRWRRKGDVDYLVRTLGRVEKSLGRRSAGTEQTFNAFQAGQLRTRERLAQLTESLTLQAAMVKAVGLGRVPRLVARLLRRLADAEVLGQLRVVGTHALFAYEALAGVMIDGGALATVDVDLLLDARRRLRIMVPDREERTIVNLIKAVDSSFEVLRGSSYRMANADGFMVDLIQPERRPPWKRDPRGADPAYGELTPVPIDGLQWLVNAPHVEALVIDDRGFPAPMVVPEPRIWSVHKLWLSQQPGRDRVKAGRDRCQARLMGEILRRTLPQFPLDDSFVQGLPGPLRVAAAALRPVAAPGTADEKPLEPDW